MELSQLPFFDEDSNAECAAPTISWRPVALDEAILAALETPPEVHETIAMAFHRKERELQALFATLTVADARELHRRLSLRLGSDPVAARFGRLVAERQARLMAFLADARRREALVSRKR